MMHNKKQMPVIKQIFPSPDISTWKQDKQWEKYNINTTNKDIKKYASIIDKAYQNSTTIKEKQASIESEIRKISTAINSDKNNTNLHFSWCYAIYFYSRVHPINTYHIDILVHDALWLLRKLNSEQIFSYDECRIRFLLEARRLLEWDEHLFPVGNELYKISQHDFPIIAQYSRLLSVIEIQKNPINNIKKSISILKLCESIDLNDKELDYYRGYSNWSMWRVSKDKKYLDTSMKYFNKILNNRNELPEHTQKALMFIKSAKNNSQK